MSLENEGDFDVLPRSRYELPPVRALIRKQPRPWHRPRKQYVREYQWCKFIKEYFEAFKLDGRPLRYLGLPGSELLDLRLFHETICAPKSLKLRFLGFNTDAAVGHPGYDESMLSFTEVKSLDFIDENSHVYPDNFNNLADPTSLVWTQASQMGHFDIVNMDLCNGFGIEPPGMVGEENTNYEAIKQLINLQSTKGGSWLLFLTTRVGQEYIRDDTFQIFKGCVYENLEECEEFASSISNELGITRENVDEVLGTPKGFFDIYSLGLAKWLICLGLSGHPQFKVELKDLLSYKVRDLNPHNDIISAVFLFTPVIRPPVDNYGLARPSQPDPLPTECELASPIVSMLSNSLNIDELLRQDQGLAANMITNTAKLMKTARYDEEAYIQWAQDQII